MRYADPYVPTLAARARGMAASTCETEPLTPAALAEADCVAILTEHRASTTTWSLNSARLIVDTRNAIAGSHAHVFKLGAPAPAHGRRRDRQDVADEKARGVDATWPWSSGSRVALIAYVYVGLSRCCCTASVADADRAADRRVAAVQCRDPQSATAMPASRSSSPRATKAHALPARIDNLLVPRLPGRRAGRSSSSPTARPTTRSSVLARYRGVGRDVVAVPAGGKALALNAGVARARFDIVVFADARQVFAPDALRELVAPFADPRGRRASPASCVLDAESPLPPQRPRPPARSTAAPARRAAALRAPRPGAAPARCARRSPTASASTGGTRSSCAVSRAASARRSAPPARSMRCAARSTGRCRPTRSSTMC